MAGSKSRRMLLKEGAMQRHFLDMASATLLWQKEPYVEILDTQSAGLLMDIQTEQPKRTSASRSRTRDLAKRVNRTPWR